MGYRRCVGLHKIKFAMAEYSIFRRVKYSVLVHSLASRGESCISILFIIAEASEYMVHDASKAKTMDRF